MGSLAKTTKKKTKCKHCRDEGIIWVENKEEKKSMLYRCPYCEQGKEHPMKELPLLSKKKKLLALTSLLHFTGS
jgi:Zn finger protein HypA/HybF involved in hydrogenase expression